MSWNGIILKYSRNKVALIRLAAAECMIRLYQVTLAVYKISRGGGVEIAKIQESLSHGCTNLDLY